MGKQAVDTRASADCRRAATSAKTVLSSKGKCSRQRLRRYCVALDSVIAVETALFHSRGRETRMIENW